MPAARSSNPAAPRRRSAAPAAAPRARKLPAAAVEATAAAFVAGFNALPGAVKGRIVQLIEAQEDAADARELTRLQAARPAGSAAEEAVPWEQVRAELAVRDAKDAAFVPAQAA